jgi:hypothetical protein
VLEKANRLDLFLVELKVSELVAHSETLLAWKLEMNWADEMVQLTDVMKVAPKDTQKVPQMDEK